MNETVEEKKVCEEMKEVPKKKEKKKTKDQQEIEALRLDNASLSDKMLRISAEMQNMKRRNSEELAKVMKYEGEEFIKRLLPVIDNFERAICMDDDNLEDEVSKFLSGFKMIYSNLLNIMAEFEVNEIESFNKPFDPTFMEAVLTESEEGKENNIVLEVLQKGYLYKDKVIRPAMVKVNQL